MATTREPDYPAEYAQLANVFMQCADGYAVDAVLNAAVQTVASAIGVICKARGCSLEDTEGYTEHVCSIIVKEVRSNWDRKKLPTDVVVKSA
jgi:hypothetical protein